MVLSVLQKEPFHDNYTTSTFNHLQWIRDLIHGIRVSGTLFQSFANGNPIWEWPIPPVSGHLAGPLSDTFFCRHNNRGTANFKIYDVRIRHSDVRSKVPKNGHSSPPKPLEVVKL